MALELSIAPAVILGRRRAAAALAVSAIALAETGRRRGGGARVWPRSAALWTPLWLLERSVTAWLALLHRATGGARMGGPTRIVRAAHGERELRRQLEDCGPVRSGHGPLERAP